MPGREWHSAPRHSTTVRFGREMVRNPTTGAIMDGKFYFMANTGIANLENGKIDPKKLEPLRIADTVGAEHWAALIQFREAVRLPTICLCNLIVSEAVRQDPLIHFDAWRLMGNL